MPTSSSAFPRTRRCFSSRHISRALNAISPQLTAATARGKVTPVIARRLPDESHWTASELSGTEAEVLNRSRMAGPLPKANIRANAFCHGERPHSFVICRRLAGNVIVGTDVCPIPNRQMTRGAPLGSNWPEPFWLWSGWKTDDKYGPACTSFPSPADCSTSTPRWTKASRRK